MVGTGVDLKALQRKPRTKSISGPGLERCHKGNRPAQPSLWHPEMSNPGQFGFQKTDPPVNGSQILVKAVFCLSTAKFQ